MTNSEQISLREAFTNKHILDVIDRVERSGDTIETLLTRLSEGPLNNFVVFSDEIRARGVKCQCEIIESYWWPQVVQFIVTNYPYVE